MESNWRMNVWIMGIDDPDTTLVASEPGTVPPSWVSNTPGPPTLVAVWEVDPGTGVTVLTRWKEKPRPDLNFPYGLEVVPDSPA